MALKSTKWLTVIGTIALCVLIVYLGQSHYLSNPESLQLYLRELGAIAPLVFILIQIIQVVIPIILVVSVVELVLLFLDRVEGFIYNYIGLLIGSYIILSWLKNMVRILY